MSFILDALRKSEHERQRSSVPGLSHVPLATPQRELPPWALIVIGLLGVAVLALGGAWWQSTRTAESDAAVLAAAPAASVTRNVDIPPQPNAIATPAPPPPVVPRTAPPARPLSQAGAGTRDDVRLGAATPPTPTPAPTTTPPSDQPTLPSAAALIAEGIALPALRLELHAFAARPGDRFVFINGRKYIEGERLAEGPEVVEIEPNGAVLSQQGRRFLLSPE